jgi:hypothetical protein
MNQAIDEALNCTLVHDMYYEVAQQCIAMLVHLVEEP